MVLLAQLLKLLHVESAPRDLVCQLLEMSAKAA